MAERAAKEPGERRGPRSQVVLLERALRGHRLLAEDDRIIEWRQGRIVRLRINGLDQPVRSAPGLRPAGMPGGMSSLSYSARSLFCIGRRMRAADLARVHRLEGIGDDSVCVIASADPSRLLSVQWRTGEPGEHDAELALLVARMLAQRVRRVSALSPQQRGQAAREHADLAAFGLIDAEFAQISAPAGGPRSVRGQHGAVLPGPVTVVGQWLRALLVRDGEAVRGLGARLNSGKPGWNRDEAGVVQAACDLAMARHFGASYDAGAVTELASLLHQAAQAAGKAAHSQRQIEAVIRHALAEPDNDVGGINPQVPFEIQDSATAIIASKRGWPPPLIDAILGYAEQTAAGRGWNPPPAT